MGEGTHHHTEGVEIVLEHSNLGYIRGHLHNLNDISCSVSDGGCGDQGCDFLTVLVGENHFSLVGISIFKRFGHRTVGTCAFLSFIRLIAVRSGFGIESLFKLTVHGHEFKIAILHRNIAGNFIEKLLVSLLGGPEFFLQTLNFRHICRYLKDQFEISVLIPNGGGMNHYRKFMAIGVYQGLPATPTRARLKCFSHRAVGFIDSVIFVYGPALTVDRISETIMVQLIGSHHFEITIVNGYKTRHFIEIFYPALEVAGHTADGRGKALNGLIDRHHSFNLYEPGGLLFNQRFEIFSIRFELVSHVYLIVGALQRNFEHIVVYRFRYEVRRIEFETLDGQVHVTVAGDHDDLGIRTLLFNDSQKLNTIDTRHFNIRKNNLRCRFSEELKGFFAIVCQKHLIPRILEGNAKDLSDTGLVVG